jgi:CTP synthase (UTP-ammonia lyase)
MRASRIALVGDRDDGVLAHRAIPKALTLAREQSGADLEWEWVHTSELSSPAERLAGFDGVWCVPASPYASTEGALGAIAYARTNGVPFLGTCGGFQHAMLEYARSVWGIANPSHAELDPEAADPVIAPLSCSLVEETGEIRFEPGSRIREVYGAPSATEGYHCRYGLGRGYEDRLASGPLRVGGRDAAGEVRAVELTGHPFFLATLFQPERSAMQGRTHPLILAFTGTFSKGRVWGHLEKS